MKRLLVMTRSFELGGAERQVIELARGIDKTRFDVTVASFYTGGALWDELLGIANIRVVALSKRGRIDPGFAARLVRATRGFDPHIVYGFLDTPNLAAITMKLFTSARIVCGVRATAIDARAYDWFTRAAAGAVVRACRLADHVITNSHQARDELVGRGLRGERVTVVPNAIDTERFRPDPHARAAKRAEWGLAMDDVVIGSVARIDPMKDHGTFLKAAARFAAGQPAARFVCVGAGPDTLRRALAQQANELGIGDRVVWAGACTDAQRVYSAFDIFAMTSAWGEGFPNAVGEAMASGVPCAVTAVGDAPRLVGDTGMVVAPRDADALAAAWEALLHTDRSALGARARERVAVEFTPALLAERTACALEGTTR